MNRLHALSRADALRRMFGVPEQTLCPALTSEKEAAAQAAHELLSLLRPNQLTLITGASGSGKTLLMRELSRKLGTRCACSDDLALPDRPVIDCLHQLELEEALELLSRFGLAEVWNYLARPHELSAGQRFRLRLAMAAAQLTRPCHRLRRHILPAVLLADEFATQLDRISARIIARTLSRFVRQQHAGISAIVATCHDDLGEPLAPDITVVCDFGHYTLHVLENRHAPRF